MQHAQVRVSAPVGLSVRSIERFVVSKRDWIARHLQAQQSSLAQLPPRHWQHAEQLFWLGQNYRLDVRDGHRNTIEAIDKTLQIRISRRVVNRQQRTRQLVIHWYQQQAQAWLDAHMPKFIARYQLQPKNWRVTHYRAKWAACNQRGQLSFSWRLFAAPPWVVEYVVLHELCHLRHFNHSAQFWQLVEHHQPDYRRAESWLKAHGNTLLNDNVFNYLNN